MATTYRSHRLVIILDIRGVGTPWRSSTADALVVTADNQRYFHGAQQTPRSRAAERLNAPSPALFLRIQAGIPMAAVRAVTMERSAGAIVVTKVQVKASLIPFFDRFLLQLDCPSVTHWDLVGRPS